MIDIIFYTQNNFDNENNSLEQPSNYNLIDPKYGFGMLSKTNVFIGANNSGKSRFLRLLYSNNFYATNKDKFRSMRSLSTTDIQTFFNNPHKIVPEYNQSIMHIYNYNTIFKDLNSISYSIGCEKKFYFPPIRGIKDYKTVIQNKLEDFSNSKNFPINDKDLINFFNSLLKLHENGLNNFDIYKEIITHEYFQKNSQVVNNIFTGGQLYTEIKKMLLGSESERKVIGDFENFLKTNFFSDYDILQLIPNDTEKVLFLKIGSDEREIFNWGDGTQQLITILYSLFKHKDENGCLFFIEEPEIYLHPGILRKFIEVINSDIFPNHQYFITTHSNAILDISTDINMSIFKFKKVKDQSANNNKPFLIEQCNYGDTSLLLELGIRNSSVFLSNCSIWVEGITDRLYIKHYLDLYFAAFPTKHKFRENIDYTFIEYGGNNITHFNFDLESNSSTNINSKYISNKIFLIADGDFNNTQQKKKDRKLALSNFLGENFYELNVNEIENLLTIDTIKKIIIKQNPTLTNNINNINWENHLDKMLGKYIDDTLINNNILNAKKYSAESGTIKDKVSFCNEARSLITDYNSLSNEAKVLIEKIYCFIEKSNND